MYSAFTLEIQSQLLCNQVTEADKMKPLQKKKKFYTGLIYSLLQLYYVVVIPNIDSFYICRMI
jgi:hypothetical protein